MGAVAILAILIFGGFSLAVVIGIVLLLSGALQSDLDRRRAEKARRRREQHPPG